MLTHLAERQAPFEHRDRCVECPLAAVEHTNKHQRCSKSVGLRNRLGNPHRFFSHVASHGEVSQFGQTPDQSHTGGHGGRGDLAEVRRAEIAGEQRPHPLEKVERLPKVPHVIVRYAQVSLSDDLDLERTAGGGQGESPLARRNSTIMRAHVGEVDA
jgi:hypothetical protein